MSYHTNEVVYSSVRKTIKPPTSSASLERSVTVLEDLASTITVNVGIVGGGAVRPDRRYFSIELTIQNGEGDTSRDLGSQRAERVVCNSTDIFESLYTDIRTRKRVFRCHDYVVVVELVSRKV
jgi:hypothetical protein